MQILFFSPYTSRRKEILFPGLKCFLVAEAITDFLSLNCPFKHIFFHDGGLTRDSEGPENELLARSKGLIPGSYFAPGVEKNR